jgi:hypothetical protein
VVYIIFILKKILCLYCGAEKNKGKKIHLPKLPSPHSLSWARNLPFFISKVKEEKARDLLTIVWVGLQDECVT